VCLANLSTDIDAEISREVCVIPCSALDALAWVAGKLTDADLLAKPCHRPEAIFIVSLPDRKSYRTMLQRVAIWRAAGAVCLIARTGNPVVDRHLKKNDCVQGVTEHTMPPKTRFLAPPAVFAAWCRKWRMQAPSPTKQNAP
jgi:hypothetical protein